MKPVKKALELSSKNGLWGDQGDGTYINPILPGDFSDPDVIRVGSDFYCISQPCIFLLEWLFCILKTW